MKTLDDQKLSKAFKDVKGHDTLSAKADAISKP